MAPTDDHARRTTDGADAGTRTSSPTTSAAGADAHLPGAPTNSAGPTTRRVQVDGREIAYWDCGEGRPVVFVHGNFASKRWFREQVETPLPDHRFIALDLPNFGASDPLDGKPTVETYAAALMGFADALGLPSFALVGHSLGGGIAQVFAVAHPERVDRMLLVAAPPPSGFPTPPGTVAAQKALRADRHAMAAGIAATMPVRQPDDFDAIVDDALAMSPDLYEPHNVGLASMELTDAAKGFTKPVWILRCAQDYLIALTMAQELEDVYPNTHLELWEEVGHTPQIEVPDRFRTLLAQFLEGSP